MTARLAPHITYPGTAQDALEAYQRIFGGEVTVRTFGDLGVTGGADGDRVMQGSLTTPQGFAILCSDAPEGAPYEAGRNITIGLDGDDPDQVRGWFDGLATGGDVIVPLQRQMWGGETGMVVDRFGIGWLVGITGGAA